MKFDKEELKQIQICLEERTRQLNQQDEELQKANWNNIGGMQAMFLDEKAFTDYKSNILKTHKEEIEYIESISIKIDEEV